MLRLFTNKCMESKASKLFIKRSIWLNLYVKVALFSFSSAYIKLHNTTGYKVLMVPTYLAAQQQNKLIQFPVCDVQLVCFSA